MNNDKRKYGSDWCGPARENFQKTPRAPWRYLFALVTCLDAVLTHFFVFAFSFMRGISVVSPFLLMQTLWKSPAVFRHRFRWDRIQSLSHGDPLFKVHYLGTEKIYSLDVQQAEEALGRLLDRTPVGASMGKEHALVVRARYVEVKEISTGRQLTKTYLRDIAYCTANATHPNVFLYICKQPGAQLHCRVFWCSRPGRARDITACLSRSFQRAMSDWQEGETNRMQLEGGTKDGQPITGKGQVKSSTTRPVDQGKGQRRRASVASHTPLRVMMRRASISN